MAETLRVIERLVASTNAHDLNQLVECFAESYVNETPAHPNRAFRGREQVRCNWTSIFGAVPNIVLRVVACAVQDGTAWTEWEMSGTRLDGSAHMMAGVIIFGVQDDRIVSARFYLEPVETAGGDVSTAVAEYTRRTRS